jgi:predicted RNA methylase
MSTGLLRDTIDKYYTLPSIAKKCINLVSKHYYLDKFDLIIEPSAGNGSFSKLIDNCIAYDIEPEDVCILKQDFLEYKHKGTDDEVLVIGNPPFGRQSSTAKAFVSHAVEFATVIAFILPKSFKKESFKKI